MVGDTAKLIFNGSYTLANFKFASDGSGGTIVYDPPVPSPSQSSSETAGSRASLAESSFGGNIALFTSYIASTFAASSHSGAMEIAEPVQSGQTLLSTPKHT